MASEVQSVVSVWSLTLFCCFGSAPVCNETITVRLTRWRTATISPWRCVCRSAGGVVHMWKLLRFRGRRVKSGEPTKLKIIQSCGAIPDNHRVKLTWSFLACIADGESRHTLTAAVLLGGPLKNKMGCGVFSVADTWVLTTGDWF